MQKVNVNNGELRLRMPLQGPITNISLYNGRNKTRFPKTGNKTTIIGASNIVFITIAITGPNWKEFTIYSERKCIYFSSENKSIILFVPFVINLILTPTGTTNIVFITIAIVRFKFISEANQA